MKKSIIPSIFIMFCFLFGCRDDKNNINEPVYINGDRIVFVSMSDLDDPNSHPNIFSISMDGSNLKQLTYGINYDCNYPVVSADGMKIIFESNKDGRPNIFSMNIDGTNIVNLTHDSTFNFYPQIAGDNTIVFQRGGSSYGGNWIRPHICKMNIDGSNKIYIMDNSESFYQPKINSNSRKIYFGGGKNNNLVLYCVNYDGTNRTALTDTSLITYADFTISNDGLKIVFDARDQKTNQADLYVMNANGTGKIKLTENLESETNPQISRDNFHITYDIDSYLGISGKRPIKLITVDGGTPKTLIEMEKARIPVFNLNGDKILFAAVNNGSQEIFSVDRDGNNLFNITKSKNDNFFPQIVP